MQEMIFHINVGFFLSVTVMASLVQSGKINSNFGNTSGETPNGTLEGIKETWEWLPEYVNNTENKNENKSWNEIHQDKGPTHPNDEQEMNWCMHMGAPFENVNFSRFQLSNRCCEKHMQSVLLEINGNQGYKCSDEIIFYKCLKRVNTAMSRSIGDHYFNKNKILNTCYEIREEDYCLKGGEHCPSVILTISTSVLPKF